MSTEHLSHKASAAEIHPNYSLRRIAVGGLALAAATGVTAGTRAAYENFVVYHQVGAPTTEGINGSPIQTVQEAADTLAAQNHVSPTDITNVTGAGQTAEGELQRKYGELFVQPGQQIEVTLQKSKLLGYKVEAHATGQDSGE